jgi:metallo-beta-lactamase class B
MSFRAGVVLLIAPLLLGAQTAPRRLQPDKAIACDSCAEWNQPRAPFKIYGNTYYVGVGGLSSILIVSTSGLVLVDGALPQSVPMIDAGIRTLGFNTRSIKLILNGHTHYDHAGGLNALQRYTGARVATGRAGVRALETGRPTPDDPQAAFPNNRFPPVRNVYGVTDGEILRLGNVTITAHATPGHTPGGTTWSWQSCEDSRCVDVVYADSISAVAAPGFRFTGGAGNPSIVDAFRHSIETVARLRCDIMIGAHPFVGNLDRKRKQGLEHPDGPNPFIDPEACRALAADAAKALEARIAEEQPSRH